MKIRVQCQQGVRRQGKDGVCHYEYKCDRFEFINRRNHCPICNGSKAREITSDKA